MTKVLFRSKDLVGKKVITSKKEEVGKVADVVLDSQQKKLGSLLIGSSQPATAQAIQYSDVHEVVGDSIFIKSKSQVKSAKNFVKKAQHPTPFSGTKVVTQNNRQVGQLTDFYYDSQTGQVKEIEVSSKKDGEEKLQRLSLDQVKKLSSKKIVLVSPPSSQKKVGQEAKIYPADTSSETSQKKRQQSSKKKQDEGIIEQAKDKIKKAL